MTVRALELTDLADLQALEIECFGDGALPHLALRQYVDLFRAGSFIAEIDGQLVGYAMGGQCTGRPDEGWIVSIAVSPRHRSTGLAGALLARTLQQLQQLGARTVWATTHPHNDAAGALLVGHGFVETGFDPSYFGPKEPRRILCRTFDEG